MSFQITSIELTCFNYVPWWQEELDCINRLIWGPATMPPNIPVTVVPDPPLYFSFNTQLVLIVNTPYEVEKTADIGPYAGPQSFYFNVFGVNYYLKCNVAQLQT